MTNIVIPFPKKTEELRTHPSAFTQSAIDKALEKLPIGVNGAVIAYANADMTGIKLGVVGKVGEHWTFVGELQKEWKGTMKAEAEVRYIW